MSAQALHGGWPLRAPVVHYVASELRSKGSVCTALQQPLVSAGAVAQGLCLWSSGASDLQPSRAPVFGCPM